MSRDSLADLLWSTRGETQARSSLRQTIFELQHLESRGGTLLVAGREDAAAGRESLVTDLELIRSASANGDWPRLLTLLESSDAGLLTDLDGLDPELDDWLRHQRAHEPTKTLAAAVDAAERCAASTGPRAALDLVGEILRLDPVNEEARRLAMRLAHELGDKVALHRHFTTLAERLRDDLDAEPSAETVALFRALSNGRAPKPAEEQSGIAEPQAGPSPASTRRRSLGLAAVLALAVASVALLAFLLWPRAGTEPRGVIVAVLPFEQQRSDRSFLAEGLWEQTRAALTRNPSIRVLGRTTTEALAQQKLAPDAYMKRLGVTHLLEGSVRRSGPELLVSVSLTRTRDGVAVWQDAFRGRMGEPFALQEAIANGIEGKLRARLAPGGGRRAEQISTTPEVYALYSEARQLIASRERQNFARAEALLRQAVKADPNYAPAWSLLGAATYFNGRIAIVDAKARAEGLAATQRAISMAPNFAPAYATLVLIEGEGSPEAEMRLRRAVALDPNYSEAWNWLGNTLSAKGRYPEALKAYERSIDLDPLFPPAVGNVSMTAIELHDDSALARLTRKITAAGASPELVNTLRAEQAYNRGDYSTALKHLAEYGIDEQGKPKRLMWLIWFHSLTAAGYYDRLHRVTGCPEWYGPMLDGKALPPTTFQGKPVLPEEFWTSMFFSAPATRAMINLGRARDLVKIYRAGFRNADDFISATARYDVLPELAISIATALRATGNADEAAYLLSVSSNRLEQVVRRFPSRTAAARFAMVRAAQGQKTQSVALLDSALDRGWSPDGRSVALDLAQEPAFRDLRGDPRFEAARKRVLDHVAKERAELGPLQV